MNNFQNEASKAELDLTGDSEEMFKARKKWDRQKKKMVTVEVIVILTDREHFKVYGKIYEVFKLVDSCREAN